MNPESLQQIYGGEISDYLPQKNTAQSSMYDAGSHEQSDRVLANLYNNQVKSRGSIDTTGIYNNTNMILPLIEREPDKFQLKLNQTLTQIAHDIGLTDNIQQRSVPNVAPREQTQDDIQQAMNNVASAIAELESMQR